MSEFLVSIEENESIFNVEINIEEQSIALNIEDNKEIIEVSIEEKNGRDFKFSDFTAEQLELLKGPPGESSLTSLGFQIVDGNLIVQDNSGHQVDLVNGHLIIN